MSQNGEDKPKCSREAKRLESAANNAKEVGENRDNGSISSNRPSSGRPSSGRPSSANSLSSRASYKSDFENGSASKLSERADDIDDDDGDGDSLMSGGSDGGGSGGSSGRGARPKTSRARPNSSRSGGSRSNGSHGDSVHPDDAATVGGAGGRGAGGDRGRGGGEADDFSHLVTALRQETETLAAQFRSGPFSGSGSSPSSEMDPNDEKLETASLHGILEELTDSLQRSGTRSGEVCESIGKVREATGELREVLEEKLNRTGIKELKNREDAEGKKKASTEAAAAAAETRATLARLTAEVAEANRMAAEAENAAAEARAKAAEAKEEIDEAQREVDEAKESSNHEEKETEEEELVVKESEANNAEDSNKDAENGSTDEPEDVYDDQFEEDEDSEQSENAEQEEQKNVKEERGEEQAEEEEEKKDPPKPVLTPRLSMKENLLEWPHHVIPVSANEDSEELGCVIRFKDEFFPAPASLHLTCRYEHELSTNAVDDSEEMVSNVVRLRHEDDDDDDNAENDDLGAPIVVAIPYTVSGRMAATKEFVVKMRGRQDEEWQTIPALALESSFAEHKGPFAEVKTNRLASFAVVAKLTRDKHTVTKKGATLKSSADHRVTITYPMGACSLISVSLEVQPAENVVSEIKSRLRHCADLITASPILHLNHSTKKPFDKPITITIPCPPNPHKSADTPGASGGSAGAESGGGRGGKGEKEKGAGHMEPLHPEGVVVIRSNKSSIFGGDPSQDSLHLLGRQTNSAQWNEMEDVPIKQVKKDVVAVDITEPINRLVVLRVAQDAQYPVRSIACTFERALQIRYAKLVFVLKEDDPRKAVVTCVPSKQLDNVLRKLNNDGYDGPPDPSDDIAMTEGQEIRLRFSGNVRMAGKDELTLNFHSHRRVLHYLDLKEVNRFGNHSSPEYRGCAEFYGTARITLEDMEDPEEVMLREAEAKAKEKKSEKESKPISLKDEKKLKDAKAAAADQSSFFRAAPDLLCKLHVSLPKPEPDQPLPPSRYRTTALDAGGIVCNSNLRWLASELGSEWESLGVRYLGLKKSRVQSIKRNNPDSQEQQIFDMLVTWRSMMPKAYNKERKINSALTRCGRYDLAEELRYRENEADNDSAGDTYDEE